MTGRVIDIQNRNAGPRVLFDRLYLPRIERALTPGKVRKRLHRKSSVEIGKRIFVLAKLSPPPAQVFPGTYDFQRRAWFEQIGVVGFALSRMRAADEDTELADTETIDSWKLPIALAIAGFSYHRRACSGSPTGRRWEVAAALITGDRSAIPADIIEAMRDSGLAHLLAISELHICLVAAIIFFAMRALLAM